MQITDRIIYFTNADPRIFDGLGEIEWTAPAKCATCGNETDFSARSVHYDGCLREIPQCNNCGTQVLGLPTNPHARLIIVERRNARERSMEEFHPTD